MEQPPVESREQSPGETVVDTVGDVGVEIADGLDLDVPIIDGVVEIGAVVLEGVVDALGALLSAVDV